ncbi:MAG: L-threonylcarbamoyladenylate synthase [Terriglobales bacterium]
MPRVLNLDAQAPAPEAIAELSDHLRAGGVAVVPTDTLYGLAANALEARAVERVFALKGRGFDKALPIVVRDQEQAREVAARLPPLFVELADRFWPGPLTLILPAAAHLPAALTAGSGGIALRQPDLPLLAALLASTGFPLTATSANRSGEPACRTAAEVMAQLGSGCPLIADAGPSPSHLPSTIVDLCGSAPRLVRAGAVAADRLASYLKL